VAPQVHARVHAEIPKATQMSSDKVIVDRKTLLTILVQAENALVEVRQLKNEIKTKK